MNRYRLAEAGTVVSNSLSISIPDGVKSRSVQRTSPNITSKSVLMSLGFSEELSEILLASWMTHSELLLRGGFECQSLCEMVDMTSFKIARVIRMSPLKESFNLLANNIVVPNPNSISQSVDTSFKFWKSLLKSVCSEKSDIRFKVLPNIPQADSIAFSLTYAKDLEYLLRLLCVPLKWIMDTLKDSEIALVIFCIWKSLTAVDAESKWATTKEAGINCNFAASTMSRAVRAIESKYPQIIERRKNPHSFSITCLDELLVFLSGKLEEWRVSLKDLLKQFSKIQNKRLASKRIIFQEVTISKSINEKIVSEASSGNLKGGFLIGQYDFSSKKIIVEGFHGVKCKTSKRTHFAYDWNSMNGYHRTKTMIRKAGEMIVAEYHYHLESAKPHPSDIRRMEKLARRYSGGIWVIFSPNDQYAFSTNIHDGRFQNDCIKITLVR